ncbi:MULTISPECIES: glycosyltransferase family 4 protein [Cyanophyceae]|uniref:Glycosyltransferase family 4 protein n=1 Tax=Leptolyngbya subtilissima DQ-A4 TaxID=2933933 RepID=A0ABV0JZ12_9CYAN|nr:glycosyltransferase family 1 protein [Nodosilinea sp. FACHB-141]MBD2112394.1 glycosyltransferase family 4 protein [Nodosilinea sp. FACHB-141]
MHVLIPVLHRPDRPTGVCRHGANLAQGLAECDEVSKVTVIIGAWQTHYFAHGFGLTSSKIRLVDVDIKNSSIGRNQWFLTDLPKLANRLCPDIVHLSFPLPFVRQWFNCPVVATIHDLYPYEYPQNFGFPQVWFNQWFLNQCINQSDGLSCVSKTTLEALKTHFPKMDQRKPLRVIYNSVENNSGQSNPPQVLKDQQHRLFILGVAQHRKNKNLDLLIRAYNALLKNNKIDSETQLILVGSPGPETSSLHQLVNSLDLQDQITFLSGLDDSKLNWLYEQATLFVMPSSTEGFCLPLIEAQAAGCPVVCSDIPIFHEIASPQCHYFDLNDSPLENLITAIAEALVYPESRKPFINTAFKQEITSQQYLDFYRCLLN